MTDGAAAGGPPGRGPTPPWWRVPVLLAGLGALGYGLALLASGGRATAPLVALAWLGAVVAGHDALLAPLSLAAAWLLTRATRRAPPAVRRVVAVGALVAAVLVLVALPALLAPGIDNPTATPRDYGRGLAILLLLDVAATAAVAAVVLRTASASRIGGRRRPTAPPGASR